MRRELALQWIFAIKSMHETQFIHHKYTVPISYSLQEHMDAPTVQILVSDKLCHHAVTRQKVRPRH